MAPIRHKKRFETEMGECHLLRNIAGHTVKSPFLCHKCRDQAWNIGASAALLVIHVHVRVATDYVDLQPVTLPPPSPTTAAATDSSDSRPRGPRPPLSTTAMRSTRASSSSVGRRVPCAGFMQKRWARSRISRRCSHCRFSARLDFLY